MYRLFSIWKISNRISVSYLFNNSASPYTIDLVPPSYLCQRKMLCGKIEIISNFNSDSTAFKLRFSNLSWHHIFKETKITQKFHHRESFVQKYMFCIFYAFNTYRQFFHRKKFRNIANGKLYSERKWNI